jgi:serine/threonine protein kinase
MRLEDNFFYTLVNREFYDSFDRYTPNAEFFDLVRGILPSDWEIVRSSTWFQCNPKKVTFPPHGWKIHLSTMPLQAAAVLTTAARLLVDHNVPFKFALDRNVLFMTNSKRWARSGAGKFVTIYPGSKDEFIKLLEVLHNALFGYNGPYILSDKRYKDGSVVYYRYGGFQRTSKVNYKGEEDLMITNPDGEAVIDERAAYFTPPEWAEEAVPVPEEADPNPELTLKSGRYVIESALAFSVTGGVYIGQDTETGNKVLIKEARPFTNPSLGEHEAVSLLKKEHRLLTILADTGLVPRPFDFFKDWEHFYLVEEFLDGKLLRGHTIEISLVLMTRPTIEKAREFYKRYRKLYGLIAEGFRILHERKVLLTDVSHYNIIVMDDGNSVKFIDFEGAQERGVDMATLLYTPGFASEQREMLARAPTLEDDYFGFGSLMLAGLMPINGIRGFGEKPLERYLDAVIADFGLPNGIRRAVFALMQTEPSKRIKPEEAIAMLEEDVSEVREPAIDTSEAKEECGNLFVERILDYLLSVATFDRTDRLFPSDPALFRTNPLNLAYGACGIAYVINEIRGEVPQQVLNWILQNPSDREQYTPGLYVGLSGMAWALLEMGYKESAIEMIRATHTHPMLYESPDLFYGVSGWGMTQLKFFLETGDELFLSKAIEGGQFLLDTQQEDETGSWWPMKDDILFGLAHGGAGVSLFLLYLYLVTGNEEFLSVGTRGIDFVLGKAIETDEAGYTWRMNEGWPTVTPYWRYGGAGIGMTLLRYDSFFGDERYKHVLDRIAVECDRKYTIFPGRFFGLAGLGEFFLDMADFGVEESEALECAWKTAAGALLFRVERDQGIAFPGEQLMRLSCDFGTGSAGIALFLNRLINRRKPPFMLDDLLETETLHQKSVAQLAVS